MARMQASLGEPEFSNDSVSCDDDIGRGGVWMGSTNADASAANYARGFLAIVGISHTSANFARDTASGPKRRRAGSGARRDGSRRERNRRNPRKRYRAGLRGASETCAGGARDSSHPDAPGK